MIDLRYVKKLVEMLDESSVDSIDISTENGVRIRISKTGPPQQRGGAAMNAALGLSLPAPQQIPVAGSAVAPAVATPETAAAARADDAKASYLEVKSPMVGTYYSAAEPGAKPYVSVGERISKGQILCIIEAMKIMNEIESEFDGVVREVLVDNAQPVEYGQVLLRVDPNA